MDGAKQPPLTDSQLDRELEAAVGIEPSPEFLARVRMRVATEPEPLWWRLDVVSAFRRTSLRRVALEPLWAVALVGVVIAVVVPQVMRPDDVKQQEAAKQVARIPEPVALVERNIAPEVASQTGASSAIGRLGGDHDSVEPFRTLPLQLSPVLVSEDERSAFEFFVAAVSDGRVPETAVEPAPSAPSEVPALAIEPLAIAPLPSLARVREEGENRWE